MRGIWNVLGYFDKSVDLLSHKKDSNDRQGPFRFLIFEDSLQFDAGNLQSKV